MPANAVTISSVTARTRGMIPHPHQQQAAWRRAPPSFATLQAIAGFAYSALFNLSGGPHAVLFVVAVVAIVVALALGTILLNRRPPDAVPTHTLIATGKLK